MSKDEEIEMRTLSLPAGGFQIKLIQLTEHSTSCNREPSHWSTIGPIVDYKVANCSIAIVTAPSEFVARL